MTTTLVSFLGEAAAQVKSEEAACWNCGLPSTKGHLNERGLCQVCALGGS